MHDDTDNRKMENFLSHDDDDDVRFDLIIGAEAGNDGSLP